MTTEKHRKRETSTNTKYRRRDTVEPSYWKRVYKSGHGFRLWSQKRISQDWRKDHEMMKVSLLVSSSVSWVSCVSRFFASFHPLSSLFRFSFWCLLVSLFSLCHWVSSGVYLSNSLSKALYFLSFCFFLFSVVFSLCVWYEAILWHPRYLSEVKCLHLFPSYPFLPSSSPLSRFLLTLILVLNSRM